MHAANSFVKLNACKCVAGIMPPGGDFDFFFINFFRVWALIFMTLTRGIHGWMQNYMNELQRDLYERTWDVHKNVINELVADGFWWKGYETSCCPVHKTRPQAGSYLFLEQWLHPGESLSASWCGYSLDHVVIGRRETESGGIGACLAAEDTSSSSHGKGWSNTIN